MRGRRESVGGKKVRLVKQIKRYEIKKLSRVVVSLKEKGEDKDEMVNNGGEERERHRKDRGSMRIETANRRTREERGREQKERKKWRRAVSGPSEGVCRLLTLFPCCSLQRARIMKRARGFRQWEGKKITSKLAAHLNWDNPKTVVLNACCTRSDVPFFPCQPCSANSSLNLAPSVALLYL